MFITRENYYILNHSKLLSLDMNFYSESLAYNEKDSAIPYNTNFNIFDRLKGSSYSFNTTS